MLRLSARISRIRIKTLLERYITTQTQGRLITQDNRYLLL